LATLKLTFSSFSLRNCIHPTLCGHS